MSHSMREGIGMLLPYAFPMWYRQETGNTEFLKGL
jgi:hypothetical protein